MMHVLYVFFKLEASFHCTFIASWLDYINTNSKIYDKIDIVEVLKDDYKKMF